MWKFYNHSGTYIGSQMKWSWMENVIELGSFVEVIDLLGVKTKKYKLRSEVKYFHLPLSTTHIASLMEGRANQW
jgi:hypothetical protein